MDIGIARTFLEVVKTGSFVGAANNLNLTQTAVSARIRVLEEQLERPVFIRNKAGAKLTPAGEQFQRFATTLVQVWARAQRAVALPPGRQTVVTIGAELSLWSPLLRHWLIWMRRECPDIAVSTQIDTADRLMEQVQDGTLDVAVLYAAPSRPGIVAELLFEEKLVLVRTTPTSVELTPEDHVQIDWGEEFAASYQAAFPDQPNAVMSISYGPLALEYILAAGGSGYFRKGFIRPYLEEGRLILVPGSPEFSHSAYAVHSSRADAGVMDRVRAGLSAAAQIIM
ncbi:MULTISPECIES: LysR family transcriptional regulator [unclassified Novosphingobium]|uniref:LysR family transcriptional regulator n=1 Tax=unclassified Novosphingobium TaxID=2644732 RepID=UPI00086870B3|nr:MULTISPECIES: LysR family transcriptional regulator [unclassified Novosphingobium]MBN9144455.1 LysR family transcriptional regulator [Novosphingobium sp.]MDR6707781.1 DNA-binding transcriptional LysR family regulator [Novosphingobium sp. 1748]ODU84013.1 MAG: LysR family transcriptional regulator [Novosphingobium sp. SCN 63-17]OJX93565.1 MAG: LysR family transcriptional regulator [Novosphingobium sp. 63-713]